MRELRFDKTLYAGASVDEAVGIFKKFAEFELIEESATWLVKIQHPDSAKERRIAGELGNYALGLTIRARGSEHV